MEKKSNKIKLNKKEIAKIIKEWKLSQKIVDYTDRGLINLAAKIIDYESRRGKLK